jgi:hypothetical protein
MKEIRDGHCEIGTEGTLLAIEKMTKRIIFFILVVLFMSCGWIPGEGEKEAVEKVCIPLCLKLDRKTYKVGAETNGFGCVFNYTCECYPVEGPAKPIIIQIDRDDITFP